MEWFINKRGYLVILGIVSISPILILIISILTHGLLKGLDLLDELIGMLLFGISIISTIIGFVSSIYFLKNHGNKNVINGIAGLTLCSPLLITYLSIFIVFIFMVY